MRVAVFSVRAYERDVLERHNQQADEPHELVFLDARLDTRTASLAHGCTAVCGFSRDDFGRKSLEALAQEGVKLVALRSAGFNQVDLDAAEDLGITVLRVPAYSPHAVAEHTVGLMLMLNRKLHRAVSRVREGNFSLGGLIGFDMHGKTAGIIGTGRIGTVVAQILHGFGCRLLVHDPKESEGVRRLGAQYVSPDALLAESDIVTLHCPLTPRSHHMIDAKAIETMKPGVMLINTSRGALVNTRALIDGLKRGHIGSVGLDVYEEEGDLFFRDLSDEVIHDDVFARLLTFPNVVVTAHQAFLTREALENIAATTVSNLTGFERGQIDEENRVSTALMSEPA